MISIPFHILKICYSCTEILKIVLLVSVILYMTEIKMPHFFWEGKRPHSYTSESYISLPCQQVLMYLRLVIMFSFFQIFLSNKEKKSKTRSKYSNRYLALWSCSYQEKKNEQHALL